MPIGTPIGPVTETDPQDLVGVATYLCIGVYTPTVLELAIGPGDDMLLL